eukprot:752264-Hanusia_phi.AAC.1
MQDLRVENENRQAKEDDDQEEEEENDDVGDDARDADAIYPQAGVVQLRLRSREKQRPSPSPSHVESKLHVLRHELQHNLGHEGHSSHVVDLTATPSFHRHHAAMCVETSLYPLEGSTSLSVLKILGSRQALILSNGRTGTSALPFLLSTRR